MKTKSPKNAKESSTIKRMRKRLEKHLVEIDSKTTDEARKKMTQAIRHALERKSDSRINLTEKSIKLFDKNEHSAKEAKATERLRLLIKKDYFRQ